MELSDIKKNGLKFLFNPKDFLFRNLGLKQTIVKNTFWLAFSEGISKILKFFLFVYIARILGAFEYGKFSFALSFASLFIIFSDVGLFKILTREFAEDRKKEKDFSTLLSLKLLLIILAYVLIFIGSLFITQEPLIRTIIWILGVQVLVNSLLVFFFAFFRARQRMEYQAWFQILQSLLATGLGLAILFAAPSAKNLSWTYLFSAGLTFFLLLLFFHFRISSLKVRFNKSIWKKYLSISYPLALAAVLGTIYSNTDSTMMGAFGQITETGWYNAAKRIAMAAVIPAGFITMSFFPVLSRFFREGWERLQNAWNYYFQAIVFLALPLAVGGFVLAQKIIDLVYDPSFFPSILAFQILLAGFVTAMLTAPFNQILIATNQQKKIFWITLSGAVFNVLLNFLLIPTYSLYGASLATLATFILIFLITIKAAFASTGLKPLNPKTNPAILTAALSSVLMSLVISWPKISHLYLLWIVLIGFLVYCFSYFLFKIILKYAKLTIYGGK